MTRNKTKSPKARRNRMQAAEVNARKRAPGTPDRGTRPAPRRPRGNVIHCERLPEGVLLYTRKQMCALLQISMRTLAEMMREGAITYLKYRRLVRFRLEDAQHCLNQSTLRPGLEDDQAQTPNAES